MEVLNKKALADKLAEEVDITKKDALATVETLFDLIASELKKGNKVDISGFGKFEVKHRAARSGINPKTKEKIKIKATDVPSFKAAKNLKETVK